MKIGYLMQAGVADMQERPLTGPANHVKYVIEELQQLGHQVRLLYYLNEQIWKSDNLEDFELVSVSWLEEGPFRLLERAIRRIQSTFQLPFAGFFDSLRFAQACRQELAGYDLFYERMGWMGYSGALASRRLGVPLILEVNGDHLSEFEMLGLAPQGAQRWLSIKLTDSAAKQASYIVATGEGWRRRFIDRWSVAPEKVVVVENGSEIVNLLNREQLSAFATSQTSSNEVTVVYVGAFEPWHGITILVQAVAKAIAQGMLVRLVLIGTGTEQSRLEQLSCELGIKTHVIFTGHLTLTEMAPYLAQAEIGASPYCGRVEYSGLKLLDYKAAGLATIASGKDGEPAVLKHGQTGWIVPPCDENALCEAIIHLANNARLRKQIGRQARLEAEKYHSWRHTAQELENLFTQVLAT